MDLTTMSLAELRELDAHVTAELKNGDSRRKAAAVEQIYAVAHALGMPLKSIFQTKESKAVKERKKPQAYKDPVNPANVWSGAGPRPAWFKSALAAGVPMEQLRG